jgi:hypothetical protein
MVCRNPENRWKKGFKQEREREMRWLEGRKGRVVEDFSRILRQTRL